MKKKTDFTAISINRIVAERFRKYSRNLTSNHSETLDLMIDFFEKAKISPKDQFVLEDYGFRYALNKRLDELEKLIRDHAVGEPIMDTMRKVDELIDRGALKQRIGKPGKFEFPEGTTFDLMNTYSHKYEETNAELSNLKARFLSLLKEMKLIKPLLGRPYYRAKFASSEIKALLARLE